MDVNYYLQREQIELMRAERAQNEPARNAHEALATLYHARIVAYRAAMVSTPHVPLSAGRPG